MVQVSDPYNTMGMTKVWKSLILVAVVMLALFHTDSAMNFNFKAIFYNSYLKFCTCSILTDAGEPSVIITLVSLMLNFSPYGSAKQAMS